MKVAKEKFTLKSGCRAILCGSKGTEPEWNPYKLGRTANSVLLFHYETLCWAGFSCETAWNMTEKAERLLIAARVLLEGLTLKRSATATQEYFPKKAAE
jgi:hypothetical protein